MRTHAPRLRVIRFIYRQKYWLGGLLATLGMLAFMAELLPGKWGLGSGGVFNATFERELRDKQGNPIKDSQGIPLKEVEKIITIQDEGKSVWDVLNLVGVLAVPIALALLGFWFQRSQQEQAADEAREEVLQLYLDRISALLVDKNLMAIAAKAEAGKLPEGTMDSIQIKQKLSPELINSKEEFLLNTALQLVNDNLAHKNLQRTPEQQALLDASLDVMRARTLSILRRFKNDTERKKSVILFLMEAKIVSKLKLNLSSADLSHVILSFASLIGVNLRKANLSNADLRSTKLNSADLSGANLRNTNLSNASLVSANLIGTNLIDADLRGANLSEAKLFGANLTNSDLRFADLFGARLSEAKFFGANLTNTDFSFAYLDRTDLSDDDLRNAKLCSTRLPKGSTLSPNRNCDELGIDLEDE